MGMAWGHRHLRHGSRVLLLPAGRANAQPGGTKGSDGSSIASGAAKTRGNQELLLLLRVSGSHPRSERVGAGPGASRDESVHPEQNPGRGASWCSLTPSCTLLHLQAAPCPQSPNPWCPPALPHMMAPSSPSSPAPAHSAPAVPSCCFHSEDRSQRCHPLHVRSVIAEIAASR